MASEIASGAKVKALSMSLIMEFFNYKSSQKRHDVERDEYD
jgi:hypothetical protein